MALSPIKREAVKAATAPVAMARLIGESAIRYYSQGQAAPVEVSNPEPVPV